MFFAMGLISLFLVSGGSRDLACDSDSMALKLSPRRSTRLVGSCAAGIPAQAADRAGAAGLGERGQ